MSGLFGDDDRDDGDEDRNGRRQERQTGFKCPRCECCDTRVLYTKNLASGHTRRRRECRACGREFSTTETPGAE